MRHEVVLITSLVADLFLCIYRDVQVFQGPESGGDGLHNDDPAHPKQVQERAQGELANRSEP